MTIPKLLRLYRDFYSQATTPSGFSIIDFDGETLISVQQFYADVLKAATYWRVKSGSQQKRQHIAIIGENSYTYLIHYFGIICSNNIVVPLNQNLGSADLAMLMDALDIDYCLYEDSYSDALVSINKAIMQVPLEMPALSDISDAATAHTEPREQDVILLLLSSGTSGTSKAVQITNANLCAFPESIGCTPDKGPYKVLQTLPLYHISGIIPLLEDMMRGHIVTLASAKTFLSDIKTTTFTKLNIVPAMADLLIRKQQTSTAVARALSSVKTILCLGAPLSPTLAQTLQKLHIQPLVYYGMTETTGTVSYLGCYKPGASGQIAPFCSVRIKDGEVLIKGITITPGYYNNPDQTRQLIDTDGWLHSGDLGYVDKDRYLHIQGRKKNVIILSNGENVSPEEWEQKLQAHPAITESRVYSKDNSIIAELYCPALQKYNETENSIQGFVTQLNKTVPLSHRIQQVIFTSTPLPRNALGKIIRLQE
ncbi:MAG: acyl--CoA ligase [Treponema sp.]|nr:acyl--CoA ligase [Treponema sp.]